MCARLPKLRTLFIQGAEITPASVKLIGVHLPQVTRFEIGVSSVGSSELALMFTHPSVFPNLRGLDVPRDKEKIAEMLRVVRPNVAVTSTYKQFFEY